MKKFGLGIIGGADGPTSVFIAGKVPEAWNSDIYSSLQLIGVRFLHIVISERFLPCSLKKVLI